MCNSPRLGPSQKECEFGRYRVVSLCHPLNIHRQSARGSPYQKVSHHAGTLLLIREYTYYLAVTSILCALPALHVRA